MFKFFFKFHNRKERRRGGRGGDDRFYRSHSNFGHTFLSYSEHTLRGRGGEGRGGEGKGGGGEGWGGEGSILFWIMEYRHKFCCICNTNVYLCSSFLLIDFVLDHIS